MKYAKYQLGLNAGELRFSHTCKSSTESCVFVHLDCGTGGLKPRGILSYVKIGPESALNRQLTDSGKTKKKPVVTRP